MIGKAVNGLISPEDDEILDHDLRLDEEDGSKDATINNELVNEM